VQKWYTVEINQALVNQVKILDSRNKRIDHYEWLTCSKKKKNPVWILDLHSSKMLLFNCS